MSEQYKLFNFLIHAVLVYYLTNFLHHDGLQSQKFLQRMFILSLGDRLLLMLSSADCESSWAVTLERRMRWEKPYKCFILILIIAIPEFIHITITIHHFCVVIVRS